MPSPITWFKDGRTACDYDGALRPLAPRIAAAFVYGSVARKSDTSRSDIDPMIVSDQLTYGDVYPVLEAAGSTLGRPVNPTVYTSSEFRKRRAARNAFLTKVLGLPKLWIVGSESEPKQAELRRSCGS